MTREERAKAAILRLTEENGDGIQSFTFDELLREFLAFADAEAAAMRERAAAVPRQVSGIIGAHYGSSIDSALCEVEAAIRALPLARPALRDDRDA